MLLKFLYLLNLLPEILDSLVQARDLLVVGLHRFVQIVYLFRVRLLTLVYLMNKWNQLLLDYMTELFLIFLCFLDALICLLYNLIDPLRDLQIIQFTSPQALKKLD